MPRESGLCASIRLLCFSWLFRRKRKSIITKWLELEQEWLGEERERKLEAFVKSMTKSQLQNLLLDVLQDGPEWQCDQFMQMYVENDPFADDEDDDSEWWDTEEE